MIAADTVTVVVLYMNVLCMNFRYGDVLLRSINAVLFRRASESRYRGMVRSCRHPANISANRNSAARRVSIVSPSLPDSLSDN